jgi:hypothetical protein
MREAIGHKLAMLVHQRHHLLANGWQQHNDIIACPSRVLRRKNLQQNIGRVYLAGHASKHLHLQACADVLSATLQVKAVQ